MDHIEIINRILEAERKAQSVADAAKDKMENFEADVRAEYEALRENYFKRADARIEKIQAEENAFAEQSIARLDAELSEDLRAVNAAVEKNMDAWVDTMFEIVCEEMTAGGA